MVFNSGFKGLNKPQIKSVS